MAADIRVEGNVIHTSHLDVTLRVLNKIALASMKPKQSRYFEIKCNNLHVARIAVNTVNAKDSKCHSLSS